ncbi:MAG TPA: alpha/beta fold hydrolase, partial [Candidatus Baltobacteraceae bacterium]|nr:alpha/beta fold hydrolase [Candidatus Baltobacteraceae bacterium]
MLAVALLAGQLHATACSIGKARLGGSCGTYTVYEDRTARSGRVIALKFVVIKAEHPSGRAVAFNPGGPGASSTVTAAAIADGLFFRYFQALHDRYDILLVDNRGTGESAPQPCNFAPADSPQFYFRQLWPDSLVRRCRAQLSTRADLSLYATSIAADDLDDVRAALGYSKLVLNGGSYGTTLFLDYARRHPTSVESLVLIGVAPPHFIIIPLQDAAGAQLSMDRLIAECNSDTDCNRNFPSLGSHFDALVRRFDKGDLSAPLRNATTKRTTVVRLSKEVFTDRLRQLLYYPENARYAPFIIDRAYRGNYMPLATMVDVVSRGFATLLAEGLNLSVTCAEDNPFITESAIRNTSAHSFEGALRVRAQQRACRIWDVHPVSAAFGEPVRSEAPMLMISGSDDPTSPAKFAQDALPYLPNARILLIRNGSHGTETQCSDQLVTEFVRAGS